MALTNKDIFIQNDFLDDVVKNPEKYNNNEESEILYKTYPHHVKGYKIFDYLLLDSVTNNYFPIFMENLYDFGLYDKYISDINNKSDKFIKVFASIFLDQYLMDAYFDNILDAAKVIDSAEEYDNIYREIALVGLSIFECDKKTLEFMKKSLKKIILKDELYSREYTPEERNKEIEWFYEYMENNQKELRKEMELKLK